MNLEALYDLADEVRESYIPIPDEDVPYVGLEHVSQQTLQLLGRGSSLEVESNKYKFKKGDILFGTLRPYFRKIIIAPFDGVCSTEYSVIRPKDSSKANFVFYFLANEKFIEYATTNSVGARPRTKWKLFSDYKIRKTTDQEKTDIGIKLRCLDDLIENNRRRIQLLEESARLLYQEWFVHLRFPGHEQVRITDGVPEGWSIKRVDSLLGKVAKKKKIKKEEYLEDGVVPCVDQSQEFIGGYIDDEEAAITENLPVVVFGDHTRIVKFIDFPFAPGADGTQLLVPNDEEIPRDFFYFMISSINVANAFYARHFKFLKAKDVLIIFSFFIISLLNLKYIYSKNSLVV